MARQGEKLRVRAALIRTNGDPYEAALACAKQEVFKPEEGWYDHQVIVTSFDQQALIWRLPKWVHRAIKRWTGWQLYRKGRTRHTYMWKRKI